MKSNPSFHEDQINLNQHFTGENSKQCHFYGFLKINDVICEFFMAVFDRNLFT